MKRACGVLLHITSLPSPYGIGTLGKAAEAFVDTLRDCGQTFWQVLPLNPVGYGNSPYQSYSAFAGEPLLIDLDDLVANGLLTKAKCDAADYGADPTFVDFEKVVKTKMPLLKEAFAAFTSSSTGGALDVAYLAFCKEESAWLDDYALFMALKEQNGGVSWIDWGDARLRNRDGAALNEAFGNLTEQINFWKFTQFFFYRQWSQLRRYANKNGVKLVGDIPIYASFDSADVWTNRRLFQLDGAGNPTKVAGVPPDYFSETGQLWGNPLYDWGAMKSDGYTWWIKRVRKSAELYDTVRIDHFRAFDTYYAIPYGEKTAVKGEWLNGPGMDLFNTIRDAKIGDNSGEYPFIIAEDLGELFDSVKVLLRDTGFPGMKILQFGFNGDNADNEHLPHNYNNNMVVYTGTHDNSTINGYLKSAVRATNAMAKSYAAPNWFEKIHMACIRSLYASSAGLVVIPMQDIIGLDDKARMNIPGKVLPSNWVWRMQRGEFKPSMAKQLRRLATTYFR
ncbi:MAG: 4-alpha-glucanotransferase [Oscillospiraceae bacterium]|nr:4-alpha-glucanotransferase [Oscillospiraceae bacterium]